VNRMLPVTIHYLADKPIKFVCLNKLSLQKRFYACLRSYDVHFRGSSHSLAITCT